MSHTGPNNMLRILCVEHHSWYVSTTWSQKKKKKGASFSVIFGQTAMYLEYKV